MKPHSIMYLTTRYVLTHAFLLVAVFMHKLSLQVYFHADLLADNAKPVEAIPCCSGFTSAVEVHCQQSPPWSVCRGMYRDDQSNPP